MCLEANRGAIHLTTAATQPSFTGTTAELGPKLEGWLAVRWSGLSFRNVTVELDGDQETAFTTSYLTDEDGEQVEVQPQR